jgi:Uma2 family endonuclease
MIASSTTSSSYYSPRSSSSKKSFATNDYQGSHEKKGSPDSYLSGNIGLDLNKKRVENIEISPIPFPSLPIPSELSASELSHISPFESVIAKLKEIDNSHVSLPIYIPHGVSSQDYYDFIEYLDNEKDILVKTLDITENDIIVHELPGCIHEQIIVVIQNRVAIYNNSMTDSDIDPLLCLGSPTTNFFGHCSYRSDSSFLNNRMPFNMRPKDHRGVAIPSIVVEVGVSQTISNLIDKAASYFTNVHVRMVILVKVFSNTSIDKITDLICIVYLRDAADNIIADRVVNFGKHGLDPEVASDIANRTEIPVDRFEGVGSSYDGPYPFSANLEIFKIVIPFTVMWYNIPEDMIDITMPLCAIDLKRIVDSIYSFMV